MKGTKSNAPAGERRTNKRLLLDAGFVRSDDDELAETTCEIVPTDAGVEATLGVVRAEEEGAAGVHRRVRLLDLYRR